MFRNILKTCLVILFPMTMFAGTSYYYSEDFSAGAGGDEWITNMAYGRGNGTLTTDVATTGMISKHTYGIENLIDGTFETAIAPEYLFSGDTNWVRNNASAHGGTWSIRSGTILNNYSSSVQITAKGPASISFWWRASCETNADWAYFYSDGVLQASNTGNTAVYKQVTYNMPAGNHVLMWTYAKNGATAAGNDCIYLDDITGLTNAAVLSLSRSCNPGTAQRVGYWIGRYDLNTNKYNVNAFDPFGVEIIRTYAWLDLLVHSDASGDLSRHAAVSMWLVDDANNIPKIQAETGVDADFWQTFNNSIEFCNEVGVWGTGDYRRYIAYFENALIPFALTNAVRPDGTTINLSNIINFNFNADSAVDSGYGYGNGVPHASNLGFRMVHTGTSIDFYVNPNPYGQYTLPNEWMYIGSRSVNWSNNIQFMFGHAQKTADYRYGGGYATTGNGPARADANFDDVLVRSVADVSAITFSPSNVGVSGSYVPVTLIISNYILPGMTNSGVNYIRIQKPDSCIGWNTDFTNVSNFQITTRYDGTTHQLTNGWYSPSRFPTNGEAAIMTNFQTNSAMSNEIRIVLGDQITYSGFATNGVIEIRMQLQITNEGFTGTPFIVYVNAEQFDLMSSGQKGKYATTGWKKCSGSGLLSAKTDPPEGQASISPSTVSYVSGTSNDVTFTYYLQFTNGGFHSNITHAAIVIPYAFTNCVITNFSSIYITNAEKMTVSKILNVTNTEGSSNVIQLDYSDLNITVGGLDVITFTVKGSPIAGSNHEWSCYADNGAVNSASPKFVTNIFFPSRVVTVSTNKINYAWDYQVVLGGNSAPQSIGISNIIPMGWFDISRDGESTDENLSGCDIVLTGYKSDIYGELHVYRHTNGTRYTFSTNNYGLINSAPIINPNGNTYISLLNDSNQSTDPVYPTRYWVALYITNTTADVFTNTVAVRITNVTAGAGSPGGGSVLNLTNLTNAVTTNVSLVDTHKVYVKFENMISNNVKQGTFNNLYFKMTLSNADRDATNYFSQMIISNAGTANKNDIGFLKLFIDTNNGTNVAFNTASNKVVMAVSMDNNNNYVLQSATPVVLTGTNDIVFWGGFDVEQNGTETNTIKLVLNTNTNVIFSDPYNDGSDPRPAVLAFPGMSFTNPIPTNAFASAIIAYDANTNWDFYLQSVTYHSMPAAFTSNQMVPVGSVNIYMDTESTNTQAFLGMDVKLSSSTASNALNGIAYIYKETNGDGVFGTGDMLVASNAVAGQNFKIDCNLSNIVTSRTLSYDQLYLVFKLTNDITPAMSNTVKFQITNLRCQGPQSNFANLTLLSGTNSIEARIDSGNVAVSQIVTNINNYNPKQGDIDQPYLKIVLAGDDKDGLNYLSYIDVKTNGLSTISDSDVSTVALYYNTNNDGLIAHSVQLSVKTLNAGYARLSLSPALALTNTNQYTLFVGCNIKSGDTNSVGKKFGFVVTNAAFGFVPGSTYNFLQNSFASGTTNGPSTQTNMTIVDYRSQLYDFYLSSVDYSTVPQSFTSNQFVPAGSATIFRDYENLTTEVFTGVDVRIGSTHSSNNVTGLAYLYLNTTNFSTTNYIGMTNVTGGQSFMIDCAVSNISTEALTPDTVYLAFMLTNDINLAKSNTVYFQITNFRCQGPNSGVFTNLTLLSTNSAEARIDSGNVAVSQILTNINNYNPKQGDIDQPYLKITLAGDDQDGTNYLSYIDVKTNGLSTIADSDVSSVALYHNTNNDGIIGHSVQLSVKTLSGGYARLSMSPALSLIGTNQYTLFVGCNIKSGDTNSVGKKVGFVVTNAAFGFVPGSTYNFLQNSFASGTTNGPATATNLVIVDYRSQPYDFYLSGVNYATTPQAFSSNQFVPAGVMTVFRDYENLTTEVLTGIDVRIGSTHSSNGITGLAYLYRNTTNFTSSNYIGVTNVVSGASFSIDCAVSNISTEALTPDTLYLAFVLTNDIELAKSNTVFFQVTNIRCQGPDGGVFTNKTLLATNSIEARADSGNVVVTFITNAVSDPMPSQGRFNVTMVHFGIRGDDPDATNALSYLDVVTNGLSTIAPANLASIKLFHDVNSNGVYDSGSDTISSVGTLNAANAVRLTLPTPMALAGTNQYYFMVGFDVSSDDTNAVGKKVGLRITNGAVGVTNMINDGFVHYSFASPVSGPATETNAVISSLTSRPWDYKILGTANVAPAAITVSNVYAMSYIDLVADGQNFSTEKITNIRYYYSGKDADVAGMVYLYRDTNDASRLSTNADLLITNFSVSSLGGGTNDIVFDEGGQSLDLLNPTRYWIGLMVTNSSPSLFTNTVALRLLDINGAGPNNNAISNKEFLTNDSASVSRVDDFKVTITAANLMTNAQKQGTYESPVMRMVITAADPDAVYYITNLILTNRGTASNADISLVQVYLDNGDVTNFSGGDIVVGAASLSTNRGTVVAFNPALAITGTNTVLWVAANIGFSAALNNTMAFQIANASDIQFGDQYADNYSQLPSVTVTAPLPAVVPTNLIIPYVSQPYDYILTGIDYSSMPQSFTTNQQLQAAVLTVGMDNDQPTNQRFIGIDGTVSNTNAGAVSGNVYGMAYLYLDTNASGVFSNNMLLGSNAVAAGAGFSITFTNTNITINQSDPSKLYLVFMVTNSLSQNSNNTVRFQVTNLRCEGPNGGVFTNLSILTNTASRVSRIDTGRVLVSYISNELIPPSPSRSSFDNKYLKISLKGDDPDATNYLSSLRVVTNSATSAPFNFIPKVAVYDSVNNMLGSLDFTAGDVTINFPSPVVLAGTNETILYVGYNVSSSLSAIGKVLGIKTVAGSFGLADGIADNFPQTSFAVNDAGPADVSNVTVKDLSQNNWDIQVVNAGNVAPVSIGGTNLYAMGYFDVICDPQESAVIQGLSNVGVVVEGNAPDAAGELRLYREIDATFTNLSFSADKFLTNAFYAGTNQTNYFTFTTNNLSQTTSTPTRFWVALRVSNTNVVGVYSNTLRTKVVYIHGYGPDDYTNTHLLDEFVLTNVATNTARFDSYNVWAAMSATNNNQVLQSSFGNYYGAVSVMSADPDAVNYLHGMTLSNIGDATASDLGQMRIFKDTGDGVFGSGVDELIMAGSYDGSGAYRLSATTPVTMERRTNILFVTYDVPFAAQLNRNIAFQIKDTASFVFTNGINDGINRTAQLTNSGPYPTACETNQVAALASLPFDYDVLNVSYSMLPKAFTTNLLVPVGSFSMYRDITTSGYSMTQRVTNIQVALSTSGTKSNITGIAYVYKETNGDGVFSTNDKLLGSADVINGADFWVPCDSNDVITPNIYVPDTLYLVFVMTNDIEPAKADSLRFQITNFDYFVEGGGKDTIPVTNTYHFTNISPVARVDSQKVVVEAIDNDMVSYFPSQNSADNPYLVIRLRGDDPNATNYLSYIDVSANGQSTVASGMIPYMALYTNKINALQLGTPATPSRAFNGTSVRLDFPVPLALAGTNVNTFYVGYNVDSASNVIDNRLGLTITNGSIGLAPVVSNTSFVLKSFVSGVMSGPTPATNVKIQKLGAQYWDVKSVFSRNKSPVQAVKNVEVPLMYFDAYRENQSLAEPEYIAGLVLSNVYTNAAFYGCINIYTNTKNDDSFTNGVCISSNNFISNLNAGITISFSNSGSYDWDNPDRYFITYTPLSFASTATNMFRVTALLSGGPNAGTTADQYWLTNLTMTPFVLDNAAVTVAVTNLLPTEALQGSNGIAAMRITMAASDDDASYSLSSLSFSIEEIDGGTNSIGNAALYSDTGTKAGEYDSGDTPVDGATGFFIGGKMKLSFNNAVSVTSNARVFYLVVQVGGDAKANGRFRISMPRADQNGFAGINVAGTSYPVVLNNYSPDTTGYCTVLPSLEVKAEDKIAAANTFINIAKGEKASVYVVNNGDAALYKAYVYDAMGYKITELAFTANRTDWGGEKANGEKVRAGLYVIIVRGPNNFQKYFKILVTK